MEHRILIIDVGTDFLDDAIKEWRNQGFESTVHDNMRDTLIDAKQNKYYLVMITMRQVNRDEVIEHLPVLRDIVEVPIVVLSEYYAASGPRARAKRSRVTREMVHQTAAWSSE